MPRTRSILLVESNRDDELLMVRVLARGSLPCEVRVARDGAEVLAYLFPPGESAAAASKGLPGMILLDATVPGLRWTELLRKLRASERTRLIPVIVMASAHVENAAALSYAHGANSYVFKPVDFSRFAKTLAQIGAYWLKLNEATGQIDSWS